MSESLYLDTGALIGLERRKARATQVVQSFYRRDAPVFTVLPVIAEWWRGSPVQARLRRTFEVAPLSERTARIAGEALGSVAAGPSAADAILMAHAAQVGAAVLTGDVGDLEALRQFFPMVRVLGL